MPARGNEDLARCRAWTRSLISCWLPERYHGDRGRCGRRTSADSGGDAGIALINSSFPSAIPACSSGLSSPESTPELATTPTGSLFWIMIALSSNLASFVSFWRFSPCGLIPSPFGCSPRSGKAFESVDYSMGLIRFWRTPIQGVDRRVLGSCELGPVRLRGLGVTHRQTRWVRVVLPRPGAWAQHAF